MEGKMDDKRFNVAYGPMTQEEKDYLVAHGLAKMDENGELYGEPETLVDSESGDGSFLQLENMTPIPRRSLRIASKNNTPLGLGPLANSPKVNSNQNHQEEKFEEIPIHSPVLAHSPAPAVESDDNKENEGFIEKFQELEIKIPDPTIYQEDITATPKKRILKFASTNNTPLPLQDKNENENIVDADENGENPFRTPENENDTTPIPRRSARIASKNNTPQQIINEIVDNFATPLVNRIVNLDGQNTTGQIQIGVNTTPRRSARIASRNNTPFPLPATNSKLETITDDSVLQCSPRTTKTTPRMKNITPRPKLFMDDECNSEMNQEFAQEDNNFELEAEVEAETIADDENTNEDNGSSFLQMEYKAQDESSPLNKTFDFEDKTIADDSEKENLNEIGAGIMQNEDDLIRFDDAEQQRERNMISFSSVNDQTTPEKSIVNVNESVKESPKIIAVEMIQDSDSSVELPGILETSFGKESVSFLQQEPEKANSPQTTKAPTPLKTPIKSIANEEYIPKILAGKKSSLFPSPLMLKPNRITELRAKKVCSPSPPRPMNLPKGVKAGMPTPRSAPVPKKPLRAATPKVVQNNTPRVIQNNTPKVIQSTTPRPKPKDTPTPNSTTPKRSAHNGCFFSPVQQNNTIGFGLKTTPKNTSTSLASKSSTGPRAPPFSASNGRGVASPLIKPQSTSTIPKLSSIPNRILFNSKMVNSPVANYIYSSPTPAKLEIVRPKAINTTEKKKIVSKIPIFSSKSNENISPTSMPARKSTASSSVSQASTRIPMPMSENIQKKPVKTLRPVYYQSGTKTPNPSRLNSMPIIQKHFGIHNESGNCSIVQREEADKKFIPSRLKTPMSYSYKK